MPNTDLTIVITGKDGVSTTFKAVGSNASAMGKSVTAGAAQADKGLQQVERSAKNTDSAFAKLKGNATAYGAALGTVGLAFSKLGEAAKNQDRLIDGLQRAYGDSSAQIIQFSEDLQDNTRFSNDAAQASLLLANALSQNYGFAAEDMQLLLERSADLAQIYGISLPDAMQRTSSAMRGEGESAELLGLNLSDAAIAAKALEAGIVGWSVPGAISEAEKAAFRFQVFMEQSEFAAGAAADAADSAGGKFRQFANTMQDAGQAAGQFLGPIGEVAAEFAPLALYAPLAGAGIGKFGAAMKAATGSATGMAAATSLLRFAFNPLTLAVTGAIAVGGLLIKSWLDQKQAAQEYEIALGNLDDTIELLRRRGDIGLAEDVDEFDFYIGKIEESTTKLNELNEARLAQPPPSPGMTPEQNAAAQKSLDLIDAEIVSLEKLQDTAGLLTPVVEKMNEAMGDPNINADAYVKWANDLLFAATATTTATDDVAAMQLILATPLSDFSRTVNVDVIRPLEQMQASLEDTMAVTEGWREQFYNLQFDGLKDAALAVRELTRSFEEGTAPVTRTIGSLTDASGEMTYFTETIALNNDQLLMARIAHDRVNEALVSEKYNTAAIVAELDRLEALDSPVEYANGLADLAYEIENTDKYVKQLTADQQALVTVMGAVTDGFGAASASVAEHNERLARLNQASIDYIANGDNILGFLVEMDADLAGATTGAGKFAAELLSSSDATLLLAYNLDQAGDALDSVLATFDQIDALGQRSAAAGSIADTLIGPPGELGTLQELWARVSQGTSDAALSQTMYNNAIAAGVTIQESNLRVQDDLNVIRANQLPLLAEQQIAYERYIGQLSEATAAEQQRALYMSDTANQAKLAELASLAYAESIGEIPTEVASEIFINAANADPILAGILEDMGYIEQNPVTGEITFIAQDAESTLEVLQDINQTIRDLVAVLDDDPLTIPVGIKDDFTAEYDAIRAKLNTEQEPVYLGVVAEDQITGPVAAMIAGIEANTITIPVTLGGTLGAGAADSVLATASAALNNIEVTVTTNDLATEDIEAVAALLNDTDGDTATVVARLDDDATGPINRVDSAHKALEGNTSTVVVKGNTSNADAAILRIRLLNGDVLATSYYNIVTRYSSIGSPGGAPFQHGGVVHKAHGGVISELAEAGPEIVKFASGGTAVAGVRGLYNLSPGDYVQPANVHGASIGSMGGINITVPIYGNVYGMEDLASEIMPIMVNAIVQADEMYRRGMGEL